MTGESDNPTRKAAEALLGMGIDPKKNKPAVPAPTKEDLNRKFRLDFSRSGKPKMTEVEPDS